MAFIVVGESAWPDPNSVFEGEGEEPFVDVVGRPVRMRSRRRLWSQTKLRPTPSGGGPGRTVLGLIGFTPLCQTSRRYLSWSWPRSAISILGCHRGWPMRPRTLHASISPRGAAGDPAVQAGERRRRDRCACRSASADEEPASVSAAAGRGEDATRHRRGRRRHSEGFEVRSRGHAAPATAPGSQSICHT